MKEVNVDIVVIGSGIAGLYYALKCAPLSKVLIITKGKIGESNTMFAQGGIAAVFGNEDSIESHIQDTLSAGDGLCKKDAVNLVIANAKKCILDLESLHVSFDKTLAGDFDLHKEGGHSYSRVVHTVDATGKEIENSLVRAVRSNPNITVLENHFVTDLIISANYCKGVIAIDKAHEDLIEIKSNIVMLASGGAGQVYSCNTNPAIATGDGYALASRAGAELMNMEFVQFHPTVLFHPQDDRFLITEALRGFGAELKNSNNEAFMKKYHAMKSLAPRDIVARAIYTEICNSGDASVYLDLREFEVMELTKHFPNILRTLNERGIDIKNEMVPVIPAAHYMYGGVMVDLWGKTSIESLYACGEVAYTGLHGANRLASNSLLEGLVFAEQAANGTVRKIKKGLFAKEYINPVRYKLNKSREDKFYFAKKQLQKIMWENAGIVRNSEGLKKCISYLSDLKEILKGSQEKDGINVSSMELLNMIETSLLISYSALERKESRGCHYREDYPEKSAILPNTNYTEVLHLHPVHDKN